MIAGWVLVIAPVANAAEPQETLKGGVQKERRIPQDPLKGGVQKERRIPPERPQSKAICEGYQHKAEQLNGQLKFAPKASARGPIPHGQPVKMICVPPNPKWTLLGEDGNYCCYSATPDFVIKKPPDPGKGPTYRGKAEKGQPGNIPCRRSYTECFGSQRVKVSSGKVKKDTPSPPKRPRPRPPCPEKLVVHSRKDLHTIVRDKWFSEGGRTGGGTLVEMRAQPESQNWAGVQITETVRLGPQTCDLPSKQAQAICGTGGHPVFTVGADQSFSVGTIKIDWDHPRGGQHRNSFADLHLVLDSGPDGRPTQRNILDTVLGGKTRSCQITCIQTYTCGTRTYGPFRITYSCTREVYVRPGGILQPNVRVGVTRVTATKR